LLWTTFQLNKDILRKPENIEYINAINQIDTSSLKINNIEYERYKNYVLRSTLYKSSNIEKKNNTYNNIKKNKYGNLQ